MRVLNRILVLVLLSGCGEPYSDGTLRIGHGGSGLNSDHPMNSKEALMNGLATGLHGIELDVQLTADSVLVAYHPELLEELTACTGKVNAMTWAEFQNCPNVNEADTASAIVRLDQLLPMLAENYPQADFTLDCKLFAQDDWWPYLRTYARALRRLNTELPNKSIVECQVEISCGCSIGSAHTSTLPIWLQSGSSIRRAATSHFAGITLSADRIDRDDVTMAHELGLKVSAFNVSGYWSRKQALQAGVDRIQLDDISY